VYFSCRFVPSLIEVHKAECLGVGIRVKFYRFSALVQQLHHNVHCRL